jgi:hypothetical protein
MHPRLAPIFAPHLSRVPSLCMVIGNGGRSRTGRCRLRYARHGGSASSKVMNFHGPFDFRVLTAMCTQRDSRRARRLPFGCAAPSGALRESSMAALHAQSRTAPAMHHDRERPIARMTRPLALPTGRRSCRQHGSLALAIAVPRPRSAAVHIGECRSIGGNLDALAVRLGTELLAGNIARGGLRGQQKRRGRPRRWQRTSST